MKIAVMIGNCKQVSQGDYRDVDITKVFDSSDSIDDMLEWAKSVDRNADFHSLRMSEVAGDASDARSESEKMLLSTGMYNDDGTLKPEFR